MIKAAVELFLHLIGSIINISSDAVNSLDMLNVRDTVKECINKLEDRITDGFEHDTDNVTNLTNLISEKTLTGAVWV